MNINNISFGKTVQVKTDKELAKIITQRASSFQLTEPETEFDKQIAKIFDDVKKRYSHAPQTLLWETEGDMYIFSGKEMEKAEKCKEDAEAVIASNLSTNDKMESLAKLRADINAFIAQTKEPYAISTEITKLNIEG